jgi:tetratricopeptide (TPR) repeat protein
MTAILPSGVEVEGLLALRLPLEQRSFLEEGRIEEAIQHLERTVEQQPRQLSARLDLIAIYRLQQRPAAAAEACERALAAHEGPVVPFLQGLHAQCVGRCAEAEQAFLKAGETMPESAAPWTALAEIQLATGRPAEAADSLDAALLRCPTDVAALTLGAEALRLLGRSAEARRRNARALEIDSANPLALERTLAADARRAGGRLAPEGAVWEAVERSARTRTAARSLLSYIRVCGGDLAGAGEMALLVSERPQLLQAHIERARLLDALGRPLAALQEIDIARTLRPHSRELALLACRVAVRAGLACRALAECEDLLTRYGDAWDITSTAAWALVNLGWRRRAADMSQAAMESQIRLPAAWLEHGRVLARAERLREAVVATEVGWSLLPRDDGFDLAAPAAFDLAVLYRRLGNAGRVMQWVRQALEACTALDETDPVRAHVLRLWIHEELVSVDAPVEVKPADVAPSFLRIEERRILTRQVSERSW